jgi:hypothetical protein
MKKEITFKNFFWGYLWLNIPFVTVFLILNLFNITPINFNGKDEYGFRGVLIIIIITPLMALCFALVNWLAIIAGLWIQDTFLSLFRKK